MNYSSSFSINTVENTIKYNVTMIVNKSQFLNSEKEERNSKIHQNILKTDIIRNIRQMQWKI